MKKKQFTKKLVLNKKTIADLSYGDMRGIQGGSATVPPCCMQETITAPGCLQKYKTQCCDTATCESCNTLCHTCECQ